MIPFLQNKFKNSRIIVFHIDENFCAQENYENITALQSTETFEIQKTLDNELSEIDASLIRIIEWRPSLNYYKEAYVKVLSIVVDFIKRIDAEKRTTAYFGRRWIKNFFKNLKNTEKTVLFKTMDIPVIVTGSGPSLEAVLPVIRNLQDYCLIIAAASSVMALSGAGICADIVITTDGGNWAMRHIYPCLRKEKTKVFAVNLCAALPSQCNNTPHLIINDGSYWQNIVLHELSAPSVLIQQKGTVTACAVELAFALSCGNIYLAGMDLSVNDIRTHTRPYGFDSLFFGCASRFTPVYSQSFARSGLLKDGGSMDIYASWFKNQLGVWKKQIFSLNDSKVFKTSVPENLKDKKNTANYFKYVSINKDKNLFYKKGVCALLKALDETQYKENLKTELAPLLFAGKNISDNELKSAITEIADYYEKG